MDAGITDHGAADRVADAKYPLRMIHGNPGMPKSIGVVNVAPPTPHPPHSAYQNWR